MDYRKEGKEEVGQGEDAEMCNGWLYRQQEAPRPPCLTHLRPVHDGRISDVIARDHVGRVRHRPTAWHTDAHDKHLHRNTEISNKYTNRNSLT